jgi:hypothetical protein
MVGLKLPLRMEPARVARLWGPIAPAPRVAPPQIINRNNSSSAPKT